MIKLRGAGYFRELLPMLPNAPSLVEARGKLPPELVEPVLRFLRAGTIWAVSSAGDDYFSGAERVFSLQSRTDGVWKWNNGLIYYVENYAVGIPADFIAHMRRCDWKPRQLTVDELNALPMTLPEI